MSDQGTQRGSESSRREAGPPSPLQGERGGTTIAEIVVARVAGIAAQEVEGVRMSGTASQAVGGFLGGITGGAQTPGISVEIGREEAAVDLSMSTEYGKSIPQIAEAVRRNVVNRIENLTGLRVKEVNISVANIYFPGEEGGQRQLKGEQES